MSSKNTSASPEPVVPLSGGIAVSPAGSVTESAPEPGPRRPAWLVISVLAAAGMSVSLQQTLMVPLVPSLPKIFDTSADTASWLLIITLLAGAVATPITTKLADMHGKRLMIVLALAIMAAGSVLLALTSSLVLALVGRALQGLAASVIPIGISVLRDELPKERVGFGIALMSATLGIGGGLGPPLAGWLYESMGWHALFWVSAVVTATILVATIVAIPESPVRTNGSFDLLGAFILSAGLTALMLVISKGTTWGWTSGLTIGLATATLVTFIFWVPLQLRTDEPMVDLRTAATRPVLLTNIASVLVTVGMMANGLLTIPFIEAPASSSFGFGLSVAEAGLAMAPSGLAMVAFAPVSGWMLGRLGGRWTLITGAAVVALSYALRPVLAAELWMVILAATLCGLGAAIAFAAMPALIMSAVPITETASANGINSLMRSVGMAGGSAGVAAIFVAMTNTYGVGGEMVTVPSEGAFSLGFALCGGFAVAATVVAFFIPTREGVGAVPEAGRGAERIIRGQLMLVGERNRPVLGTVVLTRPDGRQVDWARPTAEGHFSLALPRDGRYLLVGTARGWAPRVLVADLTGDCAPIKFELDHRLTVGGRVLRNGSPVAGATVTMFLGTGEHTGNTVTDAEGRYDFPLPPSGLYLVAAALPETGDAHAEKVQVMSESVELDIVLHESETLAG